MVRQNDQHFGIPRQVVGLWTVVVTSMLSALRAIPTIDFYEMVHLPYELLEKANRIINEISGISRVTYDGESHRNDWVE